MHLKNDFSMSHISANNIEVYVEMFIPSSMFLESRNPNKMTHRMCHALFFLKMDSTLRNVYEEDERRMPPKGKRAHGTTS